MMGDFNLHIDRMNQTRKGIREEEFVEYARDCLLEHMLWNVPGKELFSI